MSLHRRLLRPLVCLVVLAGGQTSWAQEATPKIQATSLDLGLRDQVLSRLGVRRSAVVQALERVKGAVVNIHSERAADAGMPVNASNRINGMGTGIVIDPRGYIVTNQHVVDDVSVLRCRFADGTTANAVVVARNGETDLALLKIDVPGPLPVIPVGTAQDLMVGETVIAIGNAFGYHDTVTVGIVSAIKRDVSLNKDMSYKSLIQTDASINPGNSGGPLINIHGDLVGVNVAIRAGAQNIGFAIPADHMIRSVAEMMRARRRAQLYDGMTARDHVAFSGENMLRTVVIDRVDANSPASVAGVQVGDIVTQVGDLRVACSYDLERGLLDRKSGDLVPVTVRRQDKEHRLDLVLGSPDRLVRPASTLDVIWTKLGCHLSPVPGDHVTRHNKQLHGGLEVTAVNLEGPAAKAGIKKGDILVGLHHWETVNMENVTYVLGHPELPTFNPLSFYILRAGQVRRGFFQQVN